MLFTMLLWQGWLWFLRTAAIVAYHFNVTELDTTFSSQLHWDLCIHIKKFVEFSFAWSSRWLMNTVIHRRCHLIPSSIKWWHRLSTKCQLHLTKLLRSQKLLMVACVFHAEVAWKASGVTVVLCFGHLEVGVFYSHFQLRIKWLRSLPLHWQLLFFIIPSIFNLNFMLNPIILVKTVRFLMFEFAYFAHVRWYARHFFQFLGCGWLFLFKDWRIIIRSETFPGQLFAQNGCSTFSVSFFLKNDSFALCWWCWSWDELNWGLVSVEICSLSFIGSWKQFGTTFNLKWISMRFDFFLI